MYLASAAVGALAAAGLAAMKGWGTDGSSITAAALAGGVALVTSLITLGALLALNFGMVPTRANPAPTVQPTVLTAMSTGRVLLSLAAALLVFLLLRPDGKTFWVAFLLTGLLSLLVETAWSIRWLRSAETASPAAEGGPEVRS